METITNIHYIHILLSNIISVPLKWDELNN